MTAHTQHPLATYQPASLERYQSWLRAGFSGKPFSLGGPDTDSNPRASVLINRDRLLAEVQTTLKETLQPWLIPRQVHGCHVVDAQAMETLNEADGVWLKAPGETGMILTADCVPVLVIAPEIHQVLLLHAGWRGTQAHIVGRSITQLMAQHPDLTAESLHVVIGPCIQPCCFQVSMDVAQSLAEAHQRDLHQTSTPDSPSAWIHWDNETPQNPRVSLPRLNQQQCEALGIHQIDISAQCTRCDHTSLFSYRGGDDGRQGLWAILLP